MVLPIVWIEESFQLDEEMAHKFRTLDSVVLYGKLIPTILTIVASIGLVLTIIIYLKRRGKVSIEGQKPID